MQDRRQRLLRCRIPNQNFTFGRGCGYQARATGQEIQGAQHIGSPISVIADLDQNRELQIMRIVRHPNIVELKAFYYSNGERVRPPSPSLLLRRLWSN
jgi:hypothetical protein